MDRILDLFRQLVQMEARRDSLEVGPAGSRIKIYGSFDDEEGFRRKVDAALSLRAYAQERLVEKEAKE